MNIQTKLVVWDLEDTYVAGKVRVAGKERASLQFIPFCCHGNRFNCVSIATEVDFSKKKCKF